MPVTISYGNQIVDLDNLNAKRVLINTLFSVKGIEIQRISLFQKKVVGETNILEQILSKSMDRFRIYGHVYISQCLTMAAAIM